MSWGFEGGEKLLNSTFDDGRINCGSLREEKILNLADNVGASAIGDMKL